MPRVYPPLEGTRHPQSTLPPSIVEVVAGFSAGIVSTLAVHPFDVVKTRLQVDQSFDNVRAGGSISIARDIWRKEGFFYGYYRGLTPNLVGNSVSWALYFMWYGNIKDMIQAYRGGGKSLQSVDYFAASGISGILTAVFTNPIWVIKTRMLSTSRDAPDAYLTTWQGAKDIWSKEGARGFYRGLLPSLFGVSHGAIQFMAYEQLKIWRSKLRAEHRAFSNVSTDTSTTSVGSAVGKALNTLSGSAASPATPTVTTQATPSAAEERATQVELSNWDFLALSAVSKMFAGSITYPYQVVRARLQTYDAPKRYKGAGDVMRQVFAKEGLAGFYKGLGPNIVRVLPSTCVTFLIYENTKIYLPRFYSARDANDDTVSAAS